MKLTEAQKAALIAFAEQYPDQLDTLLSGDAENIAIQFDPALAETESDAAWCANNAHEAWNLRRTLRPVPVLKAAE